MNYLPRKAMKMHKFNNDNKKFPLTDRTERDNGLASVKVWMWKDRTVRRD